MIVFAQPVICTIGIFQDGLSESERNLHRNSIVANSDGKFSREKLAGSLRVSIDSVSADVVPYLK